MSRLGKIPIEIPKGVTVEVSANEVRVSGPKGKLARAIPDGITVKVDGTRVLLTRRDDEKNSKSLHGLFRTLLMNMINGVVNGYKKELEINGVGYKAELKGKSLIIALGYSHPIEFQVPEGIKVEVEKAVKLTVTGVDKELVGNISAGLKALKVPDPYKHKGVKYFGEVLKKKAGKVIGATSTGAK